MEKTIMLSKRLMAIASLIKKGARVADIGSNHGHLPVYLAQTGIASRIIATDASASSLKAARSSAAKYAVSERIEFMVTDGLDGVPHGDKHDGVPSGSMEEGVPSGSAEEGIDTIVMSGMGAETMRDILARAKWTRGEGITAILQPQSKIPELCDWLRENGYVLKNAKLALDDGRYYPVLLVEGGVSESCSPPEIEMLARLIYEKDPLFPQYLDMLIAKAQRTLDKKKAAKEPGVLASITELAGYMALKKAYKNQ